MVTSSYHSPVALGPKPAQLSKCPTTQCLGKLVRPLILLEQGWRSRDAAELDLNWSQAAPASPELGALWGQHQPPPSAAGLAHKMELGGGGGERLKLQLKTRA